MEDFIDRILNTLLSEYGVFVSFLLLALVKVWMAKSLAEHRIVELTDRLLLVVQNNTEAITTLIGKIDHQKEINDARGN